MIFWIHFLLFTVRTFSLKLIYLKIIVNSYSPKIIIGHEINGRAFKIKKIFPKIKTILYQFGFYFPSFYEEILERYKGKECDYFLIFNENVKKFFSGVKTNFLVTGSLKNNQREKKICEKKYDIMYISEFRNIDNFDLFGLENIKDEIRKGALEYACVMHKRFSNICSSYVMKILNEYSNINKKKFCIARTSTRRDKFNKISLRDENYFNKIFAPNHFTEETDSETLAEKSRLIICLTSNLGPALMSKGHKVLFLNVHSFAIEWPFTENVIDGPFWYKGTDKKFILKKIDEMLRINDQEWKEIVKNNFNLMKYDPNNSILHDLIKKNINENKK